MILCNFSNTSYHLKWFNQSWHEVDEFIKNKGLDGIELLLHGNYDVSTIPKDLIKGVHLSYFPIWMDFYRNNEIYKEDYPTEESLVDAFGSVSKESIVERFKKDYEVSKALEAEYMVFHVGHVRLKDAFTFDYDYTDEEVLEATAQLVNESFDENSNVCLLFENLWWPGLTLNNPELIEKFMNKINYENKGIMLDLSHLMIRGGNLSLHEQVDYILKVLHGLGDQLKWIRGIHINRTDIGTYMDESHETLYYSLEQLEKTKKWQTIYEHISRMDQHLPFKSYRLKEILDLINPKYLMIEVLSHDKSEWEAYINQQMEFINVSNL
ncbi:MAG: TIM barrel protein [Clostridia bacterium]|nr:TIM barrel protein [Clostridia bacterium]